MANVKYIRKYAPRGCPLPQRLAHYTAAPNENGCTLWMGYKLISGYGTIAYKRKMHRAHRLAWTAAHGPIPKGLCVCHKCDVPSCINVDHLFLGTHAENMADREAKGRHNPARGEAVATAKLTAEEVLKIRADTRTAAKIAADYGVDPSLVYRIRSRSIWRHLA